MLDYVAQRDALWQEWLSLQASAREALTKGTSYFFLCVRQAICDKLTMDSLASTRLGQKDEGVYSHLLYLMDTYRQVIGLYENQIHPASNLVAGLCDILNSRLRQFEDVSIGHGNPILKEKLGILEAAIIHTTRQIEDIEKVYFEGSSHQLIKDILLPREYTAWEYLQQSILDKTFTTLQALYQENLCRTLASIDDLHTRKTASFYTDLLEREWEVLGLIVQVQVKAIETACLTPDESSQILSKLREAYQQIGPVVSGFRKLMQNAPPSSLHEQNITNEWLTGCITPSYDLEIDSQPFISALMHEAEAIFNQIRNNKLGTLQDLHKNIEDELSLSEEVINAFEKVEFWLVTMPEPTTLQDCSELPSENGEEGVAVESSEVPFDKPDEANEEGQDILENDDNNEDFVLEFEPCIPAAESINRETEIIIGITETLQIKIESLKESLELFKANCTNLSSGLSSGMPPSSDQDLLSAASQMKAAWCITPPLQDSINDFIEECISLEAFTAYDDRAAKFIGTQSAKIEKAIFRFRKETLFYEISTYEEILYYSVSRLRESDTLHVTSAVKVLDEAFQALEDILAEKNIIVIRPTPHEPFNGREHEILTAEETEGFSKGEIIKTMTSGYKINDHVILRANVIAAR